MKRLMWCLLVFCTIPFLTACTTKRYTNKEVKRTAITSKIGERAYNVTYKKLSVAIKEGNNYAFYNIISNNYHGKTLLVRSSPLANKKSMSVQTGYLNSEVDSYLNSEYLDSLGEVSKLIVPTSINVFNPSKSNGNDTVERKIFLLSASEMGLFKDTGILEFFAIKEHVISYQYPGIPLNPTSSWLRNSRVINNRVSSLYVTETGELASEDSNELHSVRPAFCVDSDELTVLTDLNGIKTVDGVMLDLEHVFYTSDVVPYTVNAKK